MMHQHDIVPNALIYCRVSTSKQEQEGTSLDSQEASCIKHAQAAGYTIGRVTREVYSGAELWDRPLLSRDRIDIKGGKFQALVVHATDRLSRNPIHLALIAEECQNCGVALLFVTEPLDTSPEGQLIQYVRGYAAQVEREKIRERQLRGKLTRALSGKIHNMGMDLYGYRRDRQLGVRVIYEPEACIVRQIFSWVVDEHLSVRSIARRLNEEGIPPPSAAKIHYPDLDRRPQWGKSQVTKMLHQPAYKGDGIAWRTRQPATPKDRLRPDFNRSEGYIIRPESEWVHLPKGVVPALVSTEVWQKAQELYGNNHGETARNITRPHLLRGMVRCAVCGRPMSYDTEHSSSAVRDGIYRCYSRQTAAGKCAGGRIPADKLESWVWDRICEVLQNPALIATELKRRRDEGPDPTLQSDLLTATRELSRIMKKQEGFLQRFSDAEDENFPWDLVEREIARLERDKTRWQTTLHELEERISQQQLAAEQLAALDAYCTRVAYNLDAFGFEEKRLALEALCVRVVGDRRSWTLYGSLPLDNQDSNPAGVLATTSEGCGFRQRQLPEHAWHVPARAHRQGRIGTAGRR